MALELRKSSKNLPRNAYLTFWNYPAQEIAVKIMLEVAGKQVVQEELCMPENSMRDLAGNFWVTFGDDLGKGG